MSFIAFASLTLAVAAPSRYSDLSDALRKQGLQDLGAYQTLKELTTQVGNRMSGSENDARAVAWAERKLTELGFENVRQIACMVPHWVRGSKEECVMPLGGQNTQFRITALGLSPGTPREGVTGPLVEVHSIDELKKLGDQVKGSIVFFNGPMPAEHIQTFAQYGAAGPQRFSGPAVAAAQGAVGVLVRSLSTADDDEPHTGTTRFPAEGPSCPAAAVGVQSANWMSKLMKQNPGATVRLTLSCQTLPDVPSASVIGEIRGSQKANEVIVMGGHLDSWDKGTGAHDDGAGVAHSLEALRLIKVLGWKPKRTIRVVLFANEETNGRGAEAYATFAKSSGEVALAAIESDSGGFAPRAFSTSLDAKRVGKITPWLEALNPFEIERWKPGGGGGADVGHLAELGTTLFGLEPESQRYFDYHHSHNDTLDKVNPRELELGALAMATLSWLISEEGVPVMPRPKPKSSGT